MHRATHWFFWVWTTLWCAISFPLAYKVWIVDFARTSWGTRLFMLPFVAIGAGMLYWLLIQIVHRRRVGDGTLNASRQTAQAGDTVQVTLNLERGFDDAREVTFRLIVEARDDDSWAAVDTVIASATLHSAMTSVHASLVVPRSARATSFNHRCRIEARVLPWKHAAFEGALAIAATEVKYAPSVETIALNGSDAFGKASAPPPPRGAKQIAAATWQWTARSTVLKVIGVLLIIGAFFWIRSALPWAALRSWVDGARQIDLRLTGELLFAVPFVVAGLVLAAIGLALFLGSARYTVSRGTLRSEARALGMTFFEKQFDLTGLRTLQPTAFARTNQKVSSYSLIGRDASGEARWYPITAGSIDELQRLAHWIAHTAGLSDVRFDPAVSDENMATRKHRIGGKAPSTPGERSLAGWTHAMRKIAWVVSAMAIIGFALMAASIVTSR
ncbi:MAG: hypothetical protein JNL19_12980 [Burkholderiales bacterium]|nr:hypothetical protein [Burkholderiales bacterium]